MSNPNIIRASKIIQALTDVAWKKTWPDFYFSNVVVEDSLSLFNHLLPHEVATHIRILFSDCLFMEDVEILEQYKSGKVTFQNCVFEKPCKCFSANVTIDRRCKFKDCLSINASSELEILEWEISNNLNITGAANKIVLKSINQNLLNKNFAIQIVGAFRHIAIENINSNSFSLNENLSELTEIKFSNSNILEAKFSLRTQTKIHLKKSRIENLTFLKGESLGLFINSGSKVNLARLDISMFSAIEIIDSSLKDLTFTGTNTAGDLITVNRCNVAHLNFLFANFIGVVFLRQLTFNKTHVLSMWSSNLGRTDFINCDFSKAKFEYENSKVIDCFFSETAFPNAVYLHDKINFEQAQTAFAQIAAAHLKYGDNIGVMEYHSRELEAHYRLIKWRKGHFFRSINLGLNYWSNDFGRSWSRGVLFSFGLGIIFFILLLISTDAFEFGMPMFDSSLIPAFLRFMNPLRIVELENLFSHASEYNISLSASSYILDFIGRVFVAYGYYQTIQAFRRYGKK